MTSVSRASLLAKFRRNPPVDPGSIDRCQAHLDFLLPADYIQFLHLGDGGEGFVGESYLVLWHAEELVEMNSSYQVAEAAPGLFLFGSNGGGEAYAFDTRSVVAKIVSVPFVVMELSAVLEIVPDFETFLKTLSRS
jgi:SMI1 / KNR4 family (SUKH-1)